MGCRVIEKVSGMRWEEFMFRHIFQPLEMTRVSARQLGDSNVAVLYYILTDKTPFRLPFYNASNETMISSRELTAISLQEITKIIQTTRGATC